jgi:hypothetical protein
LGGIIPAGRELLQGSMKLGSPAGTIAQDTELLTFLDKKEKLGRMKDSKLRIL